MARKHPQHYQHPYHQQHQPQRPPLGNLSGASDISPEECDERVPPAANWPDWKAQVIIAAPGFPPADVWRAVRPVGEKIAQSAGPFGQSAPTPCPVGPKPARQGQIANGAKPLPDQQDADYLVL
ncbi:MAG: hypothetical protein NZ602_17160 [Thermoguttaceae bacterium]|nr:hypothetical protein [Thermoguttaceae bacterium]